MEPVKFSWISILLILICFLKFDTNRAYQSITEEAPVWFLGLPSIVKAKHDGEEGGRQNLANKPLRKEAIQKTNKIIE